MEKFSIDAVILFVKESQNSEICRYLSGFTGSSAALLIDGSRAILISDGRYKTQAGEQSPFEFCLCVKAPEVEAKKIISDAKYKTLGFEPDKISYSLYKNFFAEFQVTLEDVSPMLSLMRRAKAPEEIKRIVDAWRAASDAYRETLKHVRVGMTEIEFANLLLYKIKEFGADGGWTHGEFIVASGERGALPHGRATRKKFERGNVVTVDFGAMVDGYMCDITRNFCLGQVSPTHQKIVDILTEAANSAAAALAPGKKGSEIDAIARKVIADRGYEKYFPHSLGHGLGLEVHESPRLSPISDDILLVGDVVTIEPGIYIEGFGGMRIEDDYLITDNGALCLTCDDDLKGVKALDLGVG